MSRRLRRDISFYKYLNSGAIPRQSKSAEEILDVTQRIEGNLTERENDSEEVLSGVSESSNQHSAQVVSLDTNEVSQGSSISSTGNLSGIITQVLHLSTKETARYQLFLRLLLV